MGARQSVRATELDERVGVLIAQQHAIGAEIVECLAELDEIEGWQGEGFRSLAHWLSIRGSFTFAEAKHFETAAARFANLGPIHDAMAQGRHSVGLVAMAAKVTTAGNVEAIAAILRDATPMQAARVLRKYDELRPRPKGGGDNDADGGDGDGDGDPPAEPEPDYWERHWVDELGRTRIDLALDSEAGALFHEAWLAARAAGEKRDDSQPESLEDRRRRNANEIARRIALTMIDAANGSGMSAPGDERFCVQVAVDLATLARVLGFDFDPLQPVRLGRQCFVPATGQRLTDVELAGILCNAKVQMLVHHKGVPLWLGNEVRTASRHQRRALMFRAGVKGCEFPGCTQTRFVDAHHVRWVSRGGPTDLDNLMLLCSYHHKQIHKHGMVVTTDGSQQFTFWQGDRCLGSTLRGDTPGDRPPDIADRPVVTDLPPPPAGITHRTPTCTGGGERLTDFGLDVYLAHLLAA